MVDSETRYAKSGGLSIAYRVIGDGPQDLVLAPGFLSHLDLAWEEPSLRRFLLRLASFRRLILFDKRGTGLSDPTPRAPTLEERTDDLIAVMDAAGSQRAALLGFSEGGTMAMMFAATQPQRTMALVLFGAWARLAKAPDYPIGVDQHLLDGMVRLVDRWGTGVGLSAWAPSRAHDPTARAWWGRLQRLAASPSMATSLFSAYPSLDIRCLLDSIQAPTLVLHRAGDRMVPAALGRYIAERIMGAKYVELEGEDHLYFAGDTDALLDEIELFLTGMRRGAAAERVVTTVMFVDVVDSTQRAAQMGDRRWTDLLSGFHAAARREVEQLRGRLISFAGDGFLATFDGPARAVECATAVRAAVGALGLAVRVGIHTGEVKLLDGDVGGIAVHIGARVMGQARPQEILVSRTVRDLVVGSGLTFEPRGVHLLKGVPGEWELLAVTSGA